MRKSFEFSMDANNERSFSETAQSQVVTPSSSMTSKKRKRSPFTVAKSKTIDLFKKVDWLSVHPAGGKVISEKDLFRKCLTKVLSEMDGYNEFAFKKDLAMHMALLLNDRRFHQTCWDSGWSLFLESQRLAWCKTSDFQRIRDYGIENVSGFDCPGMAVYGYTELLSELKALGFDKDYFEDDPYSSHYQSAGGKLKF
jgi:hypothetical protein